MWRERRDEEGEVCAFVRMAKHEMHGDSVCTKATPIQACTYLYINEKCIDKIKYGIVQI